ncbi:MAG: dihydroorotase [Acidaminobacteraceae bacterium]
MILLKNGFLVDPEGKVSGIKDILISDKVIVKIENNMKVNNTITKEIDCSGLTITPGLIDVHVHLREPGFSSKETIESGTNAALKGGFTDIVVMPNTNPRITDIETLNIANEMIKKSAVINVHQSAGISLNLDSKHSVDYKSLYDHGIRVFTDDGYTTMDENIMLSALEFTEDTEALVMSHCEDHNHSLSYKAKPSPNFVESNIVKRDIELCKSKHMKLHLTHVSTLESLKLIDEAKKNGLNVTCDVTPHHIALDNEDIDVLNPIYKVNPPIRAKEDVDYLTEGILNGLVDMIASDHAPHEMSTKCGKYEECSFGISGIETSFFITYSKLVKEKGMKLEDFIKLYTLNPKERFNIKSGSIRAGEIANISIFDLEYKSIIDSSEFVSLGRNTPFEGREVYGKTKHVFVNGDLIYFNENNI